MTEPPSPPPGDRPLGYGPAYGQPCPPPPSPYHEQPGMAGWSKVLIGAVIGMAGACAYIIQGLTEGSA